jgi:hypothetical protein
MSARQHDQAKPAGYVSEFEQFMGNFLTEHPEVVDSQRKGWYIFWNRHVDFDDVQKASEDNVPTKEYYYP